MTARNKSWREIGLSEGIGRELGKRAGTKKEPREYCILGAPAERRRLPTLPHCIAVPSAQVGLTSLFGMGRGGTPSL